ncbi:MAG: L-threonylcarbamoyladenylate synthase [Candidatus Thiodiazotropha sp.]
MALFLQIHPDNPQPRLITQAVEIIREGGLVIYPTDSSYAFGCHIGDKGAMERIRRIRKVEQSHNFTLVCRDLTEISNYAKIDNRDYRLLKALTPGPYTFIHKATKQVPRRLMHPRRKTIGIRVPDNAIVSALLEELAEPIMSTTLIMPGEEMPLTDPYEIRDLLDHQVDLIIDGGYCGFEPTTVVVMTEELPEVVRAGKGDTSMFDV